VELYKDEFLIHMNVSPFHIDYKIILDYFHIFHKNYSSKYKTNYLHSKLFFKIIYSNSWTTIFCWTYTCIISLSRLTLSIKWTNNILTTITLSHMICFYVYLSCTSIIFEKTYWSSIEINMTNINYNGRKKSLNLIPLVSCSENNESYEDILP
jgi:hypothetical protein